MYRPQSYGFYRRPRQSTAQKEPALFGIHDERRNCVYERQGVGPSFLGSQRVRYDVIVGKLREQWLATKRVATSRDHLPNRPWVRAEVVPIVLTIQTREV